MNVTGAIIAGLDATAIMTLLMYTAPRMGMPKMDIIGMLGSMFTTDKRTATGIGLVVHFMMGVVFAVVYAYAWSIGIGSVGLVVGPDLRHRARRRGHRHDASDDAHAPPTARHAGRPEDNARPTDGPRRIRARPGRDLRRVLINSITAGGRRRPGMYVMHRPSRPPFFFTRYRTQPVLGHERRPRCGLTTGSAYPGDWPDCLYPWCWRPARPRLRARGPNHRRQRPTPLPQRPQQLPPPTPRPNLQTFPERKQRT